MLQTKLIALYVEQMHSNWDLYPKHMAFSYNVSPHETTGETPYFRDRVKRMNYPW
jgi:hypothetical protein